MLWYWATFGPTGGPPTLSLRAGPKRDCYRVLAQDDTGKTTPARGRTAARRRPQRPSPAPARPASAPTAGSCARRSTGAVRSNAIR